MSKDPNELTEAELAEMSPNDRAWYERISAQVARDAAEAANEVPVVFTREMAQAVQRHADGEVADLLRLVNHRFNPDRDEYQKRLDVWQSIYDLITEAMRAKGMV